MKIFHVCESLTGGPASYFLEILPYQMSIYGKGSVSVLIPEDHRVHLNSINCEIRTYRRTGRDYKSLYRLAKAIYRIAKKDNVEIIHLHSTFAGIIGRILRPFLPSGIKIVYCAHCWYFDRPNYGLSGLFSVYVEKILCRLTDAIINISPHEMVLLKKFGFDNDKLVLVVSGISDSNVPIKKNFDIAHRKIKALYVGRFDYQKGFDLLINSLNYVDNDRFEIEIIGAPVVSSDASFKVPEKVKVQGWMNRDQLAMHMSNADVLLMPSRWEGLPLVALEALRAGLPIIGSNIPPIEDIISNDINLNVGYLIDFHDEKKLSETIYNISTESICEMSDNSRKLFETKYSSKRMCVEISGVYDSIIGGPGLNGINKADLV